MADVGKQIVEFTMEVVEHYFEQSMLRGLTVREQQLYRSGREVLEQFELEGRLIGAGLFTGVLRQVDEGESN